MATLSTLQCVNNGRNTGLGPCTLDPKNIKGGFFCPPGYYIPQAAMATGLRAQLLADSRADSKAARIIPFANFCDFKDNSEDTVEEKMGYGDVTTVRDGIYDWQFRTRVGGLDLSNRYRARNRNSDSYLFVDSANVIWATSAVDPSGVPVVGAVPPIEFYQNVFKINDGKAGTQYWSKFRMQPLYLNENVAFIQDAGFDILSSILGLQDITLTVTADATPGVYHVTALAGLAKVNMATLGAISTALATGSLWVCANVTTGVSITTSSVALGTGANAGTFTVTMTTTAPPYPAGAGDKVSINLVGPTELATGSVPGFESLGAALIAHN